MIKRLLELTVILGMAISVVCFSIAITGCQTTPQVVAIKTTDGVLTTADQAIAAWADYVVKQRSVIAQMPSGSDKEAASTALAIKELKVKNAYEQYQVAGRSAVLLGSTASGVNSGADVAAALASLLTLVTQFISH